MVEWRMPSSRCPAVSARWKNFCEVLTWAQLGLHRKPHGLLNVAGFYDSLLAFFDHAVEKNFIRQIHRELISTESRPFA